MYRIREVLLTDYWTICKMLRAESCGKFGIAHELTKVFPLKTINTQRTEHRSCFFKKHVCMYKSTLEPLNLEVENVDTIRNTHHTLS